MTNMDRANHGGKENQDRRIKHQMRQIERRESRKQSIELRPYLPGIWQYGDGAVAMVR